MYVLKLVPEECWELPASNSGLLILPGFPARNLWEVKKIPAMVWVWQWILIALTLLRDQAPSFSHPGRKRES